MAQTLLGPWPKTANGGAGWSGEVLASGDTLAFAELGISVTLDDLYTGIDLPEAPDATF